MTVQRAAAAWGPSRRRGSLYLWLAESGRHVVGVRLGVGPGAPSSSSSRRGARCRAWPSDGRRRRPRDSRGARGRPASPSWQFPGSSCFAEAGSSPQVRDSHLICWARCRRKTHRPTLKTQEKGAIKAPECEALSFLLVLAVWHRVFSLLFEAGLPRHQGTHRTAMDLHRSPCFSTLTTGSCHGLPDCPLLPATLDLPQTDKAVTSPSQGPTAPSR